MKTSTVIGIRDHLVQTHPYCDIYHKAAHFAGIYMTSKVYNHRAGNSNITQLPKLKRDNEPLNLNECPEKLETDIVNLLLGPIAEAKYVAACDNEIFNCKLIDFNALNYYSGTNDLMLVDEYLQCLTPSKSERIKKKAELFGKAFDFINDCRNWKAVTRLAEYMIEQNKSTIDFSETVSALECLENERRHEYADRWRSHA